MPNDNDKPKTFMDQLSELSFTLNSQGVFALMLQENSADAEKALRDMPDRRLKEILRASQALSALVSQVRDAQGDQPGDVQDRSGTERRADDT